MRARNATNPALLALRHHVSGAVARGEAVAIVEQRERRERAPDWRADVHRVACDLEHGTGGDFARAMRQAAGTRRAFVATGKHAAMVAFYSDVLTLLQRRADTLAAGRNA